MKRNVIYLSLCFILIICIFLLTGCDIGTVSSTKYVESEYSSDDFVGDKWNETTLTEYFKNLGFVNIKLIPREHAGDTFSEYRYDNNIFSVKIGSSELFDNVFEKGDSLNTSDTIFIEYNKNPILTIENCQKLKNILIDESIDCLEFAKNYENQYVKFDAYVSYYMEYMGGTSRIISVKFGDYEEKDKYNARTLRIETENFGLVQADLKKLSEGKNITITAKIDARATEYYKTLSLDPIDIDIK